MKKLSVQEEIFGLQIVINFSFFFSRHRFFADEKKSSLDYSTIATVESARQHST